MESVIPDSLRRRLHDRFSIVRTTAARPGLSGAFVFRCDCCAGGIDDQSFALRRWPVGTSWQRIEYVHRVLRFADQSGLVPQLQLIDGSHTVFRQDDGTYWELASWLAGKPIDQAATIQQIAAGATAISRFHSAVTSLHQEYQAAPAVVARLRRIDQLDDSLSPALRCDFRHLREPLGEAVQTARKLLLDKWPQVRLSILDHLRLWSVKPVFTQTVLRDVHREHVLFVGAEPTGLIDFDAIRVDTPITDLARWTGSFLADRNDSDSVWRHVLAAYQRSRTFTKEADLTDAQELAKLLHRSTAWISLANWTTWLGPNARRFNLNDESVSLGIAKRIDNLLAITSRDA